MDQITLDRIKLMHPTLRDQLEKDYIEINKKLPKGVRLRFSHTYRSPKEQFDLFRKRPKVTNADAWQSIHNYGLAFDIVILLDENGDGKFEKASFAIDTHWKRVVKFFKDKGWTNGGDWKKFPDHPHFEVPGHNWRKLKKKIEAGDSFKDNNGIIYPNL